MTVYILYSGSNNPDREVHGVYSSSGKYQTAAAKVKKFAKDNGLGYFCTTLDVMELDAEPEMPQV